MIVRQLTGEPPSSARRDSLARPLTINQLRDFHAAGTACLLYDPWRSNVRHNKNSP